LFLQNMNYKNAFINRYPAKLLVFWEKIIHAQLLNVADDGFLYASLSELFMV
jgi:hypothetical protein